MWYVACCALSTCPQTKTHRKSTAAPLAFLGERLSTWNRTTRRVPSAHLSRHCGLISFVWVNLYHRATLGRACGAQSAVAVGRVRIHIIDVTCTAPHIVTHGWYILDQKRLLVSCLILPLSSSVGIHERQDTLMLLLLHSRLMMWRM